jgi:hypothetical protein
MYPATNGQITSTFMLCSRAHCSADFAISDANTLLIPVLSVNPRMATLTSDNRVTLQNYTAGSSAAGRKGVRLGIASPRSVLGSRLVERDGARMILVAVAFTYNYQ